MFTSYNWLINFSCFLFVFCSSTSAIFTVVLIMSSMIPLTMLSLDTDETVSIFWSALALSSALIHVLAHFQRTTCSQIYFRFSSYLLPKPLLIRSTAFICNIDRDWMIYHKHPIRSLLTSMLRKANIYALSFEKDKGK